MFLDPSLWLYPCVSFEELERLPDKPGIYYAIDSNCRVRYVGKANSLRNRWRNHEKRDRLLNEGCEYLRYRIAPKHWLLFEEACDIWKFRPDINEKYPNPDRENGSQAPSF